MSEQAGPKDVTITTLTAEVRTLVVGSRQVTLSVYRQLDTVPLAQLTPMGRVRDRDEVRLIGRGPEGSLCAAAMPSAPDAPRITSADVRGRVHTCSYAPYPDYLRNKQSHLKDRRTLAMPDGTAVEIMNSATMTCHERLGAGIEHPHLGIRDCGWSATQEQTQDMAEVVAVWRARVEYAKAMRDLPLLVLAGLR